MLEFGEGLTLFDEWWWLQSDDKHLTCTTYSRSRLFTLLGYLLYYSIEVSYRQRLPNPYASFRTCFARSPHCQHLYLTACRWSSTSFSTINVVVCSSILRDLSTCHYPWLYVGLTVFVLVYFICKRLISVFFNNLPTSRLVIWSKYAMFTTWQQTLLALSAFTINL